MMRATNRDHVTRNGSVARAPAATLLLVSAFLFFPGPTAGATAPLFETNRHIGQFQIWEVPGGKWGPYESAERACRVEVYSPAYPDGNFRGLVALASPAFSFACLCHSNNNTCGFAYPVCPAGFTSSDCHIDIGEGGQARTICSWTPGGCVRSGPDPNKNAGGCSAEGRGTPLVGNPINVATGNKYQRERDYSSSNSLLRMERNYNSAALPSTPNSFGAVWRASFDKRIVHAAMVNAEAITIYRPDGKAYHFALQGEEWVGDSDVGARLVERLDATGERIGWRYVADDGMVETFSIDGILVSEQHPSGQTLAYVADVGGNIVEVRDHRANSLSLVRDVSFRITSITASDGARFEYDYDESGNLISVTYPDTTPADPADNRRRQYLYQDARFPHALTGILDENGNRYATWTYDAQGRAMSSEHAGGADRTTLAYNPDGTTTTTNALGKQTTYHFDVIHGVYRVTRVEGHPSANCAGANQAYSYDANGFLASKTDWNGNLTTYAHDARGLELSRTEAAGTAQARTITTQWHADFRLPVRITEPGRITEFTYDGEGRLLSRVEREAP